MMRSPNNARRSLLRPDGMLPGPAGRAAVPHEAAEEILVERQNDNQLEVLVDQIGAVKRVAMGISDRTKDSHVLLNDMDKEMGTVQSLVVGASDKLKGLFKIGSSRHMIYLMLFVIFVFVLIYFMVKYAGFFTPHLISNRWGRR